MGHVVVRFVLPLMPHRVEPFVRHVLEDDAEQDGARLRHVHHHLRDGTRCDRKTPSTKECYTFRDSNECVKLLLQLVWWRAEQHLKG